jgi:hypothetical protein
MRLSGVIRGTENQLFDTVDIFYSFSVASQNVNGVCWIDPSTTVQFAFVYDKQNDIVRFKSDYRLCFCNYELYNKYYLNIRYSNQVNTSNFLCIPWLKFRETTIGVAIPQLIENIIGYIPNVIVF